MVCDISTIQAGFCDRLRRVTFCLAVARVRGDASLAIRDAVNTFCPYRLLDLITVDGFELCECDRSEGDMDEAIYRSNSGPSYHVVRKIKPPDVPLSDLRLLGLWKQAYRWLRPAPAVAGRLDELGLGSDCVGLHVRLTDKVAERPDPTQIGRDEIAVCEARALRLIEKHRCRGRQRVFLACDNADSKTHWTSLLQDRGIAVVSNHTQFHDGQLRQTNGHDFAVDLFGLASCPAIVGLVRSGVVQTAARIHGRRPPLSVRERSIKVLTHWAWRLTKAAWSSTL